ncbi:hypothetical protein K1718_26095 [Roseibium porphyridii]|uniref:Nuclear transport factor 2 family protein n=1 Tax=Roseibium porphyridii TaxID=2866279 RepID=A0ABY8FAB2_9HYPH|nr:hypothetical protein [Roseibium sp. KMA01]WFE89583.1 hypothetical protein K1718_26095 [Roseibium sp. KMA01]
MRASSILLSIALLFNLAYPAAAQLTEAQIRNGFKDHAAMAQYYRWYQYYERPDGGVANALDILSKDVTITSGLGTANGQEEYKERVAKLPATWKNAHHVQSAEITHGEDGKLTLAAKIIYQNQGMLPDGAVRQADLSYTVEMVPGEDVLPLLSNVLIEQDSDTTVKSFQDAYAENRLRSLVHYWLALIEDPSRNPEPVQEILADDFSLNFSSGAITDFDGFKAWLAGPASQVAASTHVISNFAVEDLGAEDYAITMDFDWAGITPDGVELIAKTRHTWRATNDVEERFARIKSVDVEVLEPFRPRGN